MVVSGTTDEAGWQVYAKPGKAYFRNASLVYEEYIDPVPESFSLVVAKNPSDSPCSVSGGGSYAANATVTVGYTVAEGWKFIGFEGADGNGTVTMTGNMSVIVNFERIPVLGEEVPQTVTGTLFGPDEVAQGVSGVCYEILVDGQSKGFSYSSNGTFTYSGMIPSGSSVDVRVLWYEYRDAIGKVSKVPVNKTLGAVTVPQDLTPPTIETQKPFVSINATVTGTQVLANGTTRTVTQGRVSFSASGQGGIGDTMGFVSSGDGGGFGSSGGSFGSGSINYTYQPPGTVSGSESNGATSADIAALRNDVREADAAARAAASANLEGINQLTQTIDAKFPSPSPTPSPDPDPTPEGDGNVIAQAAIAAAGPIPTAQTVSASVTTGPTGGQSGFWTVNLGSFGVMNFDPMSNATVASVLNWLKLLISLLCTGWAMMWTWQHIDATMKAVHLLPYGTNLGMSGAGGDATAWAYMILARVIPRIISLIVVTMVANVFVWESQLAIISSFTGFSFSSVTGGVSVVNAINAHLATGNAAVAAAVKLFASVIPVDHIAVCAGNCFLTLGFTFLATNAAAIYKRNLG